MRKVLVILFALMLIVPVVAQERTGRIAGVVVDDDGNPIPGVTVTLFTTAGAPMQAISTAEGVFRFLGLPPSTGYALKAELEGFKTRTETEIIVNVGGTTDIRLAMEMGALEEEITVVALSPVVDVKQTKLSSTISYETLQSLPSARDPWVILQMTPAVQIDRENVGGNESGQQSYYAGLGDSGTQSIWTMDGIDITDPAAMGASPSYYDYDMFEEINVTLGGADVETMTGGVALNLVSRRGENKMTFGGRFYYTESAFQAKPSGSDYEAVEKIFPGYGYNQIRDIKDFGFNVGGPLLKDKIWWWGSYGVQYIKTKVINGSNDDTDLVNYSAKVNIQIIPENRLELFIHSGSKFKFGRSSSSTYPSGYNQKGKYHFGSPVVKIQDEHMFGDSLFLSAKYGFSDSGFGMWPADDEALTRVRTYDRSARLYDSSWWFFSERPNNQASLHGTYFNDDLLGASHEIKMGVEYMKRWNGGSSGSGAGNLRYNYNYNTKTVDWDGDGTRDIVLDQFGVDLRYLYIYRGWMQYEGGLNHISAFLSDTLTWGRLTLKIGFRYDHQNPWRSADIVSTIFSGPSDQANWENAYDIQQSFLGPQVATAIGNIFPGMSTADVPTSTTQDWKFISPRFGMTYDITGDGKTILKLSGAMYQDRMGSGSGYPWRLGGTGGWMRFWWHDADGSNTTSLNELYWANYDTAERAAYRAFDDAGNFVGNWDRDENLMWGGYDPDNPGATTDPWYNVDPDWHGSNTYEIIASLERELMPDVMVGVDLTWRKYNEWWTDRDYADFFGGRLLERTDYQEAPNKVPSSFPGVDLGDAAGKPFYVWKAGINDVYGWYVTNTPSDYYDQYMGFTVRFNKRLSNKWMLNANFSYQNQSNNYGDTWPLNITNQWAEDGQTYAYNVGGGSGKVSQPLFSRWMLKAQGLYQLPYDFNVSFTFNAREGHINIRNLWVHDETSPNSRDTSETMRTEIFGSTRLANFFNLNLRLEKILRIGDTGRVYLMVDAFNVFNNNVLNRQRPVNPGDLYLSDMTFSADSRSGEPNEILNPRVFRFGVRFQF